MSIATVQFMSAALWRMATYTVLLLEGDAVGPGPYPVLYQLHGGNENHTAWLHNSTLARRIRNLPLIVVLPDGAQTRWANGGQPFTHYEDFLIQDLAEHLRRTFHTTAGNWAIGGNSMGGLGAMRLGLKYAQQFASVWAHSGVYPTADALPEHWHWTGSADDLDCSHLAMQADPQTLPRISFDCGHDDHLLASNRAFHAFLEQRAVRHTYREHPGSHSWNYWEEHIDDAPQQHIAVLKLR